MSSGSESDDDYVPEEAPEKLSEEESADDETEKQYENELEQKTKKRKLIEDSKGKKKQKTKNMRSKVKVIEEVEDEPEEKATEELDPEEQKKRDDDLWAMFLDGTDTKPKPKETTPVTNKDTTTTAPLKAIVNKPETKNQSNDAKEREKRIFEFAGETIVVENNVIKERIKASESPATVSALPGLGSGGSGISGVLGALNKKNKLSVLEKSKLDWTTLKEEEGIEEEIQSHNKGKHGYLDRRDFLERSDMRQYELEREVRMSRRSNR